MDVVVVVVGVGLIGLVLYWLLVITEGTFLGSSVVALMYNWVARRYDAMKNFDPDFEELFLEQPLVSALGGLKDPSVLDVATGTGRIPLLLSGSGRFYGRIVGLDLSRSMLTVAAKKLRQRSADEIDNGPSRTFFIWQNAMQLPFPNESFDLVCCVEALEFMPRPTQVLAEMTRVLRAGGVMLITRRRGFEQRLMPGKAWSPSVFSEEMNRLGLDASKALPWQKDYDLVWTWKPDQDGENERASRINGIEDLLCCPVCGTLTLEADVSDLTCMCCDRKYPVAKDGVIEMAERKGLWRFAH